MDDGKRCRRRPDAEDEREQRDGGEAGRTPARAEREAHVTHDVVRPREPAGVEHGLPEPNRATELSRGERGRGRAVEPLRLVPARLHLEMEAQLLVELALEAAAPKKRAHAVRVLSHDSHGGRQANCRTSWTASANFRQVAFSRAS